jgi:hypothetical protein
MVCDIGFFESHSILKIFRFEILLIKLINTNSLLNTLLLKLIASIQKEQQAEIKGAETQNVDFLDLLKDEDEEGIFSRNINIYFFSAKRIFSRSESGASSDEREISSSENETLEESEDSYSGFDMKKYSGLIF